MWAPLRKHFAPLVLQAGYEPECKICSMLFAANIGIEKEVSVTAIMIALFIFYIYTLLLYVNTTHTFSRS